MIAVAIEGPQRGDHDDCQDQLREGEEDVHAAHRRRVDTSPEVPRRDAGEASDDQRKPDGGERDDDRDPNRRDHSTELIASELIGPEPVVGGRRRER